MRSYLVYLFMLFPLSGYAENLSGEWIAYSQDVIGRKNTPLMERLSIEQQGNKFIGSNRSYILTQANRPNILRIWSLEKIKGLVQGNKLTNVSYCVLDDPKASLACPNYSAELIYFVLENGQLNMYRQYNYTYDDNLQQLRYTYRKIQTFRRCRLNDKCRQN